MNITEKTNKLVFVLQQLSYKEHKKGTEGTAMGPIWNILNPFIYMVILATYYQNIMKHDIEKFPVFVFIGITIFSLYNTATRSALKSVVGNKNLLINSKVSAETFVFAKIVLALKNYFYSLIALIPVLIFYKIPVTLRWIEFIPILVISLILITGISKILAVLYVYFADIEHLYNVFMIMMFFVSGAFASLEHLSERLQYIVSFNPIYLSIYMTRNCIMYNTSSYWGAWIKLIIWAAGTYILGSFIFEKKKNDFVNKM